MLTRALRETGIEKIADEAILEGMPVEVFFSSMLEEQNNGECMVGASAAFSVGEESSDNGCLQELSESEHIKVISSDRHVIKDVQDFAISRMKDQTQPTLEYLESRNIAYNTREQ
ncbi:hypothetical protein GOV04_05185 [Candidatus Woesearchaeota archaeon]|nr:hypothetical protein [Candidatus Woesearchaeota archaeon]